MQRNMGNFALLALLQSQNKSDASASSSATTNDSYANRTFPSFHPSADRSSNQLSVPHSSSFLPPHSPYSPNYSVLTTEANDEESLDEFFDEQKSDDFFDPDWFEFEDVLIHVSSFAKGLIVIKPVGSDEISHNGKSTPIQHDLESSTASFDEHPPQTEQPEQPILIKDRKIYFSKDGAEPTANTERAVSLLSKITRFGKTKRDLYVMAALPNPGIISQDSLVLIKTTFKRELYYKSAEDKFIKINLSSSELQTVLNSLSLNESLKRPTPFKLQLSSGMLDILEEQITPHRKSTLAVVTPENRASLTQKYRFALTKTRDGVQLSEMDENNHMIDLNIKSRELKEYLSKIGLPGQLIDAQATDIALTGYQLDKLEQLAALLKRRVYLATMMNEDAEQIKHDYVLIKKPGRVDLFIEQKQDGQALYQPITTSNIDTLTPVVNSTLPQTCYTKKSDGSFTLVDLNDALTRRNLLKNNNLTLYFTDASGEYHPVMESSSAIKRQLNADTVIVMRKSDDQTFESTEASLKEIKKQLAQDQYELYYKNADGLFFKVDISSVQLKKHLMELGAIEQVNKKSDTVLTLNSQQLESIDNLVKLYTSVTAYNHQRKDEVFVSLPAVGLYVQPWLSSNSDHADFRLSGTGFKKFHTAGCLFGSTLKGVDQLQRKFPMVKHDICFYEDEVITSISFNPNALNPYEQMLFIELEKIAKFINMHADRSDVSKPPVLSYHLPFIDYVLFGLSLLAIGRITFDALEKLFIKTFQQKNKHISEIKKICAQHGIVVVFESPFANLFDLKLLEQEFETAIATTSAKKHRSKSKPVKYAFSKAILRMLNIPESRFVNHQASTSASSPMTEAELTDKLLEHLIANNHNPEHKQAWIAFLAAAQKTGDTEINKLTAIANKTLQALEADPSPRNPENMAKLYQDMIACLANSDQLKPLVALFDQAKESADSEAMNRFYDAAIAAKKIHAIYSLHAQVEPLSVTHKEREDLDKLCNKALTDMTAESIQALLAFGVNKRKINSIEDIFKIGNAAMVGLSTQSCSNDFETCSILPVSEKQIQVNYDRLKKELPEAVAGAYHGIMNITYIPTAICADNSDKQNAGLFFYYGGEQSESIAKAIRKLTKYASDNMALHSHSKSQQYGDLSEHAFSLERALFSSPHDSPVMEAGRSSMESSLNAAFRIGNM
jgi:hypothetical protein